jgi:hypothetical protein
VTVPRGWRTTTLPASTVLTCIISIAPWRAAPAFCLRVGSSFYGEGGETLGEHGYSKDYRPDLKQMILGLVVDGSGSPLCTEMWPGNTADVTTLLPLIDRLRQRPRASPPVPRRATLRHRPRLRRGRPRHDLGRHHRRARRAPADEDRALDRKLKGTVLEQLGEHAAMPSRSQIRRNSKGPPMRLAATDNDPSASASSALMSNTCQ